MNEETNLICFLSKWPWTCYPISVYHMYTTIQHMYNLPNLLLLLWLLVIRVAHIYHIIDTEPNMRLNSSIEATKPLKPEHTTTRKWNTVMHMGVYFKNSLCYCWFNELALSSLICAYICFKMNVQVAGTIIITKMTTNSCALLTNDIQEENLFVFYLIIFNVTII